VEIVQSAVLGRLAHVGATDTIKVHVYGIEFGLWTASVKLCNGETFAVACGTAPRRLRQGETVENVWPAHRAARGATGRECLCDQPRHGGQHAPLCPSYGAR
jgi:hypothetical protein